MTASTNTTITAVLNGPSSTADTFGTIASPTVTQIATTTFSVTTTRTLFTWTVSAASMSGFNKGLELIFKAASGLGNAVTWTVESVQLEKGSNATSFDYRPYGTELLLCQRYYQSFTGILACTGSPTTTLYGNLPFIVPMRISPTMGQTGVLAFDTPGVATYTQSSTSIGTNAVTPTGAFFSMDNFTGLTSYRTYNQSNTNYVNLSAEL